MVQLPNSLEEALDQSREATVAALADGYTRLQVELVFPEIEIQAQSLAQQFMSIFADRIAQLKVFFPDAGAAALARRDWGEVAFKIEDIGLGRSPIQNKIKPEDEVFLLVNASGVEVAEVEKLCNAVEDRPVVLLIPHLEDSIGAIGIGLAGRQRRDRFLKTLTSCYYVRPLEGGALFRCYPGLWQVYLQSGGEYKLVAELPDKPFGDEIDRILANEMETGNNETTEAPRSKKSGFFANMQRFLKALNS